MSQDTSSNSGSSAVQVIVYWAIVAVPLGWGIYKTIDKSKALFQGTNVTAAASPTPDATIPPKAAAVPLVTPSNTMATTPMQIPETTPAPAPAASPFSTAEPSATVAPIDTPTVPKT